MDVSLKPRRNSDLIFINALDIWVIKLEFLGWNIC